MIKSGRIVLLLDGYDEMAQHLHARERRTCLEALAQLSAGGAKGIITSRPNYFTEAEELHVFETLYRTLSFNRRSMALIDEQVLETERQLDDLLGKFLYRAERRLEDLTVEQTEHLVKRTLANDPKGQEVVIGLLKRVFRNINSSDEVPLSGKPVIIGYLLDVVESLKQREKDNVENGEIGIVKKLTEWQIFKMVIDELMLRDHRRTPEVLPVQRRHFLQQLAAYLSKKDSPAVTEEIFIDLIRKNFANEIRSLTPEDKKDYVERAFANLRGSATLDRLNTPGTYGWQFSHNSLREFLVTEHLLDGLDSENMVHIDVPITDAMTFFACGKREEEIKCHLNHLIGVWPYRRERNSVGQFLCLLWNAFARLYAGEADPVRNLLICISGDQLGLNNIELSRVDFSTEKAPADLSRANFSDSLMKGTSFVGANLERASFDNCLLESVSFRNADLTNASFKSVSLIDVNMSSAVLDGSDFTGVDPEALSIIIEMDLQPKIVTGHHALGYLKFCGAITPTVSPSIVAGYHRDYPIVVKVLKKLGEQNIRQRRGLVQRGAARQNVEFANAFISCLESANLIVSPRNRKDLIQVTEVGKSQIRHFCETNELPEAAIGYLSSV